MTVKAIEGARSTSWRIHFDTRICSTRSPTPSTPTMRTAGREASWRSCAAAQSLTPREREVIASLVKGNAQQGPVAAELAMTEPDSEVHRPTCA